ncbi:MAG: TetR/AcrR family transcriptional regulator [Mycobacteriales bacterium]
MLFLPWQTSGVTVVRTAREQARAAIVRATKQAALEQLARTGAAGLSMRAVARELGLASSALYRYFPSRDALLTALIVDGYNQAGEAAETAEQLARVDGADAGARWLAVCRAIRSWAVSQPHLYALVYGSPVPGYAAPQDTIEPAIRLSRVMARVLLDAAASAELRPPTRPLVGLPLVSAGVIEVAGGVPAPPYEDLLERSVVLLVALFGAVSYLLFGHLHKALLDDDAWFDAAMAVAAEGVGLLLPLGPA